MFFHRIERIRDIDAMGTTITDALLDKDRYNIIPLINPSGAAGKFLMDQERSTILSDYSGERVHIFYIDEKTKTDYKPFMTRVLTEVTAISDEEVKEPCIIVFFPGREHLVVLEMVVIENYRKFRSQMFQLIDALQTGDPLMHIRRLKHNQKTIYISREHCHLIKELHRDVYRFFV